MPRLAGSEEGNSLGPELIAMRIDPLQVNGTTSHRPKATIACLISETFWVIRCSSKDTLARDVALLFGVQPLDAICLLV
jgi:hypothetical protein